MNAFEIVKKFEEKVAKYSEAPYGVAVDSCTNALLLSCLYHRVDKVILPCKTYIGVAQAVLNAGGRIEWKDYRWQGAYKLNPYPIVDSARRFKRGMYKKGTLYCLSFHWTKHLSLGKGGMILTDSKAAYEWLKRVRFDGRNEGVPCKEDKFIVPGYHCYIMPELAAKGIILMDNMPDKNKDLIELNYPDLSKKLEGLC